jgi:hypothetical protein
MPFSKRYTTISKAYSVNKELRDKTAAYLAGSNITKKKFRDIIPTLSRIR